MFTARRAHTEGGGGEHGARRGRTHELNDLKVCVLCVEFFALVLHCVCHFSCSLGARANTQTALERTMEYNARVAARYRRLHNCALMLKDRVQELLGDKRAREVELSDTHDVSGRL